MKYHYRLATSREQAYWQGRLTPLIRAVFIDRSKYKKPHQGPRECARRLRQKASHHE